MNVLLAHVFKLNFGKILLKRKDFLFSKFFRTILVFFKLEV